MKNDRVTPLLSLWCACMVFVAVASGAMASPPPGSGKHAADAKIASGSTAKAGWPSHLRVLSGPVGGEWYEIGAKMADIFSKRLIPTTNRAGGGFSNIENITRKNADIAFTVASLLSPTIGKEDGASLSGSALHKEGTTRRLDSRNSVLLSRLYPQVLYFILRKDFADANNITSVESLLNTKIPLRFASLKVGTASEFILDMLLREGYSTSFEQLKKQGWFLTFSNYGEAADSFVAGSIDCFAYTAGVTVPLILTMEAHTPLVVLPIEQKALDIMALKLKTQSYTIQPGTYKSVAAPLQTLADHACLIVRKDLPDDFVAAVCELLWEEGVVNHRQISTKSILPEGLEAHPGAVHFWKSLEK